MLGKSLLICALLAACSAAPADPATNACAGLDDVAAAHCILHASDWGSLASVSTQKDIKGYPFVGLKSIADGVSTGIPYLYLTAMDVTVKDLLADNRTTLLVSLAQSEYCASSGLDPMNPLCPRLMITGQLTKVTDSEEYANAKQALFKRHPEFQYYPTDHEWFVAKLKPVSVLLLNAHGPIKQVPLDLYLTSKKSAKN